MKDRKVFYEITDTTTGTKEQLYRKSKLWFANEFRDSKSVLQIDDKDAGQLLGKGNTDIQYKYIVNTSAQCNFTVRIDLKDNKFRIQIYNINYQWETSGSSTKSIEDLQTIYSGRYYKKIAPPTNSEIEHIIASYKKTMATEDVESF